VAVSESFQPLTNTSAKLTKQQAIKIRIDTIVRELLHKQLFSFPHESQPEEAMHKITKVAAEILGHKAFINGKPRIPALDTELSKLLKGSKVGEGIPIMLAWLKGWDDTNRFGDLS
jgi:hypothetical protein